MIITISFFVSGLVPFEDSFMDSLSNITDFVKQLKNFYFDLFFFGWQFRDCIRSFLGTMVVITVP